VHSKVLFWLGLLALLPYVNVLQNGFVWDDRIFITDNYPIRHPESHLAHNGLGNYLFRLGRIPDAKQEYAQVVLLDPDGTQSHTNLGNVYCTELNWPRGIAEYRKALALDPRLAPTWYAPGVAYQLQGVLDSALTQYQRVLQFEPLYVPALKGSGGILLEKKEYGFAEGYFRRALTIAPDDSELKISTERILHLQSGQGK